MATDLQRETRYTLNLPPADNGETFFKKGLIDFDRPAVKVAREKMRKCALLCIASGAKKSKHGARRGRNAERMRQVRAAKKMKGALPPLAGEWHAWIPLVYPL
ncbi:hypothetical protein CYMTET_16081 [Cymbomonas tetramitiformis]|uniref:Uncharacterized protein n=1 Tax=Cymbomonas tetramitiformis TaxID=36881 RepID=A0AAE0GE92_9CHLO|nr:hypothetical protein CYMTET_16081 [Cymbomonas tetramitiformis]